MDHNQNILTHDELTDLGKSLTAENCTDLTQIGGGRNSRVYKFKGDGHKHYILKHYHISDIDDTRSRVETEFNSSVFMWEHEISQIPQPINADFDNRVAVYSFVNGRKIKAEEVDNTKITALTDFLTQLQKISVLPESSDLPIAAEASFSLDRLFENISGRLNKIQEYSTEASYGEELKQFLDEKLIPEFDKFKNESVMIYEGAEMTAEECIPHEWTTLSPSDFGFHNALLSNDDKMIFLDFEYFGRDDPVKSVADFILHPAIRLSKENYYTFFRTMLEIYAEKDKTFKTRLTSLFPLYVVKWCTILLNEFVPEHYERRLFALGKSHETDILREQLDKAEKMLEELDEWNLTLNRWLKAI